MKRRSKMKIGSYWGANSNPSYNPDAANSGGGYWQPSGGAVVSVNGKDVIVWYEDTSCGDLGYNVRIVVETLGHRWSFYDSSMDGETSDSPAQIDAILRSIGGVLRCNATMLLNLVCEAVNIAASDSAA